MQAARPGYVPPPPWQVPLVQMAFCGQTLPHAPQFAASRETSLQNVLPRPSAHACSGAPQVGAPPQTPLLQKTPFGQKRPQPPQLPGSLLVSVQYVPLPLITGQVCCGKLQAGWMQRPVGGSHVLPFLQTIGDDMQEGWQAPDWQTKPGRPQSASVAQASLQKPNAPLVGDPTQVWPPGHGRSVSHRLEQKPMGQPKRIWSMQKLPEQSPLRVHDEPKAAWPGALHWPRLQEPLQSTPQPPQLRKSSCVDVQPDGHIVRPPPPQLPGPVPPIMQTPSLQISLGEQPWPQPPQLLASRKKSAQYVLAPAPWHWFGAIGGHGPAIAAPAS
jgi:hypothetical protein